MTHRSPPPAAPDGAYAGRILGGRYQLTGRIAAGGMAEVWEARDSVLGRPVAVKLLYPHLAVDASLVQRFRAEAVAAARLHHPSIVSIYDTISEGGTEAIVMELIRGRTLRTFLDERGPLDPADAVDIGAEVADALHAAHCAGVVHRDVKPANILLCDDDRVMVTDFGIAKIYDDTDLTQTGIMLGSVKYLSPEQVESDPVDGRSDIYSLGIVLYEGLTGVPPFTGDSAASMALARLHTRPAPPRQLRPTIPPTLEAVILRCLALDPADRYLTALELRDALLATKVRSLAGRRDPDPTAYADRTQIGLGFHPEPAGRPDPGPAEPLEPGPRRRRRRSLTPIFVTAMVVAALAVTGALIWKTTQGQELLERVQQGTNLSIPGAVRDDALAISDVHTFDPPPGDGKEIDDRAPLLVDGNPATGWNTEGYDTRKLGGIKPGVGIWVKLNRATKVRHVRVATAVKGWSAEVRVARAPGATIDDWGPAAATATDIQGDADFDAGGTEGQYVLIWITDLGPPAGTGKWGSHDYGITLNEVTVTGG